MKVDVKAILEKERPHCSFCGGGDRGIAYEHGETKQGASYHQVTCDACGNLMMVTERAADLRFSVQSVIKYHALWEIMFVNDDGAIVAVRRSWSEVEP